MIGRLRSKSKMATTSLNYVEFSRNTRITNNFNTSIFSRCGFSSFARFFYCTTIKNTSNYLLLCSSHIFFVLMLFVAVCVFFYSLNFLSCRQGRAEWFTFGSLMHMRVFHEIFVLFYFIFLVLFCVLVRICMFYIFFICFSLIHGVSSKWKLRIRRKPA